MEAELKAQVREMVKNRQIREAMTLLAQHRDDPEAQKMLHTLQQRIEQARAKKSQSDHTQDSTSLDNAPTDDLDEITNPLDYIRQMIADRRYEEAYERLWVIRENPEARDMLETLEGVVDVAGKKDKRRRNEYSSRWNSERIISNITVSLILLALFRDSRAIFAILTYWLYDLIASPPGRLNPWHVGVAIFLAISAAFIFRDVIPTLLVSLTGDGAPLPTPTLPIPTATPSS